MTEALIWSGVLALCAAGLATARMPMPAAARVVPLVLSGALLWTRTLA
jgi:hypothetical protein